MLFPTRASSLIAALVIAAPALAAPALAQQVSSPARQAFAKHVAKPAQPAPWGFALPTGYQKTCGMRFVCYTGIPLDCAPDTRPYQSIPDHQCFCLHDGCPR
jgi:hypothetical protein